MADETVEQRGRRIAAESAAVKMRCVLDQFVITAEIGTIDGRVLVLLDPADVAKIDDEIDELRWQADHQDCVL